ncbi:unnamed protein product [Fraxinus pennsylvanica]|uniref:Ubiquitin-like domain-containing protein n=1 Tax=Fraxinus pennsylvanica TaxID=56036 RepID=A0AAD2E229_9LAMI|nr:unnamed protein product [Fraxinus pennsylvanica]
MIKRRLNFNGGKSENAATTSSRGSKEEEVKCEMRPGGMLVQQRSGNFGVPSPKLRIRVAYGALRYEIAAHSLATFGELKKLLTVETGLQPGEQRIIFRGKERENGEYLDICGVKDRSKVILIEDPESIERRFIEMRRNVKIQTVHRLINDVTEEVDKLADQVSAIEKSIASGDKVAELRVTTLTEMLMRQAVKLDSISTEGDACALKDFQGKRVHKCVETLDYVLKVSNEREKPVIVTTKWETFDQLCNTTTTNWQLFE